VGLPPILRNSLEKPLKAFSSERRKPIVEKVRERKYACGGFAGLTLSKRRIG
jgi:hypothetical protein